MAISITNVVAGQFEKQVLPTVVPDAAATVPSVSAGSASALSTISNGALNALSGIATLKNKKRLPWPNDLNKYASYNYIFTLFALDFENTNFPESGYLVGKGQEKLPVILKSGSGKPNNRINTSLGRTEFYMDDVVITAKTAFSEKTGNSQAFLIEFTVVEPYSMGMFMLAIQQAAYKMKWQNHIEAVYCLSVQFMGEDQSGSYSAIPKTTKYYSMQFNTIDMSVEGGGATYRCVARVSSESALLHSSVKLTSEISFAGKTVQEVLQSGSKSLTAIFNQRLKDIANANQITTPDEIVILFPTDIASKASSPKASGTVETNSAPAISPVSQASVRAVDNTIDASNSLFQTIGINKDSLRNTFYQLGSVNEIGLSPMGYSSTREGIAESLGATIYDEKTHRWDQEQIYKKIESSTFQVGQDSTIINAINQIILTSDYAKNALSKDPVNGKRRMWTIIPSVYYIQSKENLSKNGSYPKLFVYIVSPYDVLSTAQPVPGQKVQDTVYQQLLNQCVKSYDYIYSGKNTEVLRLDLKFRENFKAIYANDSYRTYRENLTKEQNSELVQESTDIVNKGGSTTNNPEDGLNYLLSFIGTTPSTGGSIGGVETEAHRAARYFYDSMLRGKDLAELEMDINGDPYWMASAGTGNYRAGGTDLDNVNTDLSVNIHNGEVDMIVKFKTPTDINDTTGLYNLNGSKALLQYSGIYKVKEVQHKFKDGQFFQTIKAKKRMIGKDETKAPTTETLASIPAVKDGTAVSINTATDTSGGIASA